jgi:metal-responsive CopG/Arc/MetJ family transcriptional regulator
MISIPEEFLKEIDKLATIEHRNRSELFREALRCYLGKIKMKAKPIDNPQVKRAVKDMKEVAGKWRGRWSSANIIRQMRKDKF